MINKHVNLINSNNSNMPLEHRSFLIVGLCRYSIKQIATKVIYNIKNLHIVSLIISMVQNLLFFQNLDHF